MPDELIEGHKQIRQFIDPNMGKSYYFEKVVPKIRDVLMERSYQKWGKPRVFTYKTLLLSRLLEIKII